MRPPWLDCFPDLDEALERLRDIAHDETERVSAVSRRPMAA
jgi:hypothetical protein